ncbi:MAG: hypothetical protein PHX80_05540 [Candidatus Nanoarchaeia archaeon]|nr:hypothetical protein [Candidatus Nanoarchaeia archaeon]
MPYKNAEYTHHRQLSPKLFDKSTFRTVKVSHTKYRGKKFNVPGAKAIEGKLKKTGKRKVQSFLIPKK